MPFDEISAKEMRPVIWMFTRTNWFDVPECYKKYYCNKCKRVDWLKATQGGIVAPPIFPLKMPDFFQTSDRRAFVVSRNVKKAFEEYDKTIAQFFPIPKYDNQFVLLPTRLFMPPAKVPVFPKWIPENGPWRTEDSRCKSCKHFPDLCFHQEWFTIPSDVIFAGIVIDVKSMVLAVSREFSDHIRAAKLSGLSVEKNAFANPKK